MDVAQNKPPDSPSPRPADSIPKDSESIESNVENSAAMQSLQHISEPVEETEDRTLGAGTRSDDTSMIDAPVSNHTAIQQPQQPTESAEMAKHDEPIIKQEESSTMEIDSCTPGQSSIHDVSDPAQALGSTGTLSAQPCRSTPESDKDSYFGPSTPRPQQTMDNNDDSESTVSTNVDSSDDYHPSSPDVGDSIPPQTKRGTKRKKTQPISATRNGDAKDATTKTIEHEMAKENMKRLMDKRNNLEKKPMDENISEKERIELGSIGGCIEKARADASRLREALKEDNCTTDGTGKTVRAASSTTALLKGQKAKNSKEWWARANEGRKSAIENKRKLLDQKPVAPRRQALNKRQKKGKIFVDRMKDGKEQSQKKLPLSLGKLRYNNPMQARMARTDLSEGSNITASTKKERVMQELSSASNGASPESIKADLAKLNQASRSFGLGQCKPVDDKWSLHGLTTHLYDHQMLGTSWMQGREHSKDKGGINADEMGMGKTIQTLGCIVQNRPGPRDKEAGRRTTLIVVPACAVEQWMNEIETHADESYIRDVYHFKASKRERMRSLKRKDIIVTSYSEVLSAYFPPKVRAEFEAKTCTPERRKELAEEHLGDLFKITFWRVVLDEGHMIKSATSQTFHACRHIDATYRWCLTGTPMPNTAEELWPYLSFLKVAWAQSLSSFKQMLGNLEHPSNKKRFEAIIQEVVQRRTMADILCGKRLYEIPECFEEVKTFPLTQEEEILYRVVEQRYRDIINQLMRDLRKRGQQVKPTDLKTYLVFLLRLRQATAHPFLLEPALKDTLYQQDLEKIQSNLAQVGGRIPVIEQIRSWRARNRVETDKEGAAATKLDQNDFGSSSFGHEIKMDDYIEMALADSEDNNICNLCYKDYTDPYAAGCGHVFCRKCLQAVAAKGNSSSTKVDVCPQCSKPLKGVHALDTSESPQGGEDDSEITSSATEMGVSPSESLSQGLENFDDLVAVRKRMENIMAPKATKGRDDRKLGNDYYNIQPRTKIEDKTFLRASDRKYPEPMVPSAKTTVIKELVLEWQEEAPADKIIIFTQFLEESQIIGRMLQAEGVSFLYYFGGMSDKQKNDAIEGFHKEDAIKVLIASLKCGGVALNVTCANRVIMADPWWNASVELQAFARVFRIGQTKKTHFVSLLAVNTIDERIASLQAEKLKNIEEALQHSKTPSVEETISLFGRLTEDEDGALVIEEDYIE